MPFIASKIERSFIRVKIILIIKLIINIVTTIRNGINE